ncbi:carbon monoxide dehydrogenase [Rhizobium rhizosphaerae]|uniref:Carbon monoxide dehydrogenase n=1 Tax=Xaviernesmea rhizosphaerae TaxID=1672749 RepID=A0A1Q9AEM0_9HYPH|nr:carbon monoxide dehydrogenase subunit G [Xaviernesmea rhizosphaerae]OLP53395.1 carbon monoxide dehydrogenase [Xaviernesmea rhizosphaerae]
MELSGEERIPLPRDAVWAALNDPAVLKSCIPGCETLAWTSDTTLDARVRVKIAFIPMTFGGTITLSELRPPEGYKIDAQGHGGLAGFAKGSADVDLQESGGDAQAETQLTYRIHAALGGKLAELGASLAQSSADRIARRFFADFTAAARRRMAEG